MKDWIFPFWRPLRATPMVRSELQGDRGFATANALMISMALALVVTALEAAAIIELKASQSALKRTQAAFALDGAQQSATLTLLQMNSSTRLAWTIVGARDAVTMLAEPEASKITWESAVKLNDATLRQRFGVQNPEELRARIRNVQTIGGHAATWDLDTAAIWTDCAPSYLSRYGQAQRLSLAKPMEPSEGGFNWRIGELWRVRATMADGWTDDRIIRLTGDPVHPAAVVERRLIRRASGMARNCDSLADAQ